MLCADNIRICQGDGGVLLLSQQASEDCFHSCACSCSCFTFCFTTDGCPNNPRRSTRSRSRSRGRSRTIAIGGRCWCCCFKQQEHSRECERERERGIGAFALLKDFYDGGTSIWKVNLLLIRGDPDGAPTRLM